MQSGFESTYRSYLLGKNEIRIEIIIMTSIPFLWFNCTKNAGMNIPIFSHSSYFILFVKLRKMFHSIIYFTIFTLVFLKIRTNFKKITLEISNFIKKLYYIKINKIIFRIF